MRAMSRSRSIAQLGFAVRPVVVAIAVLGAVSPLSAMDGDPSMHRDDPERILALAADAAGGEWEQAQAARETLQSEFGAYAVAGLLRYLNMSSDVEERVSAIFTLRRLGSEATLAMIAGFHSADGSVRRNLCQVFAQVRDDRAGPTLAWAAEHDEDPLVRGEASKALAAIGVSGGDGASRLADLSGRFLAGHPSTTHGDEAKTRVFFWNGKRVGNRDVTEAMYGAAYALIFAKDAMAADPSNPGAQAAYVAAADALRAAIADDEDWSAEAARLDTLVQLGGAGAAPEAPEAFDVAAVEGASGTLDSSDKRLRYNKALTSYKSGSPDVVEVLGRALSESAIRQILVVDPNPESLNALVSGLRTVDTYAVGASTGAQGLARAKSAPVKDVIILRSTLRDVPVDRLVGAFSRDHRTADAAIIVISSEAEADALETALGDKVVAVVPSAGLGVLRPALDTAFDRVTLNDERLSAATISRQAAEALASLSGAQLAPASEALVGAIGRADDVQIPALRALGKVGAAEGQVPAAQLLADDGASAPARAAAGLALAGILEKHPMRPSTEVALRKALGNDDVDVRNAAARALGRAQSLGTAQRSKLLLGEALEF